VKFPKSVFFFVWIQQQTNSCFKPMRNSFPKFCPTQNNGNGAHKHVERGGKKKESSSVSFSGSFLGFETPN
jgi:hypothetical protein